MYNLFNYVDFLTLISFLFIGNGYIPTSCLREILRELDDQLTDKELDMMIEEIDTDGSGTVDFDGKIVKFFGDLRNFLFKKTFLLEFMEMMTGEV